MAEFQEVMRQAKRMCVTVNDCGQCELMTDAGCRFAIFADDAKYSHEIERIVMDWAAKHPEPRYPTWIEWWNENFQGKGRRMLTPCSFAPPAELGCSIGMDGCMSAPYKCWHTPISADVAEKLGVKPIGGDADA